MIKTILATLLLTAPVLTVQPAQANVGCKYVGRNYVCAANGSYYIRFYTGEEMHGQCSSGARFSKSIPFVAANEIHRSICNIELDLI